MLRGMRLRAALLAPFLALPFGAALAYETDTLTDRELPLPDVTEPLDQRVNDILRESIARTNEVTACRAPPEVAHQALARAIHARTAADELVGRRGGGLSALGFDRLSAWVEKGGVPHRRIAHRRDILADVPPLDAPILTFAGLCSTVRVAGTLIGTDKLDHFFEEGYAAWRHSGFGEDPDAAVRWSTWTELTYYGLLTSQAFSYGDLKANWDGMAFYDSLLDPIVGVAEVDSDGCLRPTTPFSWRDRVTWEYDEVLNPPVYTPIAQQGVTKHLAEHRDEYCAGFQAWQAPEADALLALALASSPPYASADAPPRSDPWRLRELCTEPSSPSGQASLDSVVEAGPGAPPTRRPARRRGP